jgi:hypothetical protein
MIKLSNLISVVLMFMFASMSNAAERPALPAAATPNSEAVKPVEQPSPSKSKTSPSAKNQDADFKDELSVDKKTEYQEVVDAYKSYLATVKSDVIDEIRSYRIEIVKINKKKKDLYKSLSLEAQEYLAKESAMKRKLPVNKRKFSE